MTKTLNEVHLIGRISGDPEVRELPSGDSLVTFRLVLPRDAGARRRSKQLVDTIECVGWTARIQRSMKRCADGEFAEVRGSLRRRFSRAHGFPQSWVSIDVSECRVIKGEQ